MATIAEQIARTKNPRIADALEHEPDPKVVPTSGLLPELSIGHGVVRVYRDGSMNWIAGRACRTIQAKRIAEAVRNYLVVSPRPTTA